MGNFLIGLLAFSWIWLSSPASAHLRQIADDNSWIFDGSANQWSAGFDDDELVRTLFAPEDSRADRWNKENCGCLLSPQLDRCLSVDGASVKPGAHLNETLTLESVHVGKQDLSVGRYLQLIATSSLLERHSLRYSLPSPTISLAVGLEHKESFQLPAGHFKFLRVWSVKFLHPARQDMMIVSLTLFPGQGLQRPL